MSKVTPSALRALSVAAGTVGLAAVGAAAAAPAGAAAGLPGLGSGLPLSTNALSALKGLTAHNGGQIAGVPIAGLPVLAQLPEAMDAAGPGLQNVPGLSGMDFGSPEAQTRSRLAEPGRPSPAHGGPGTMLPNGSATPSAAAAQTAQIIQAAAAQAAHPAPAAAPPAAPPKANGPLDNLPVVGGLAGNLPLLGGASPLDSLPVGGLAGGLGHLG
ncbi:hypothetical protein ACFQ9X_50285 [Catenulispora yoronensis]